MIENLGTTMDQFDCIDFSDNEIRYISMKSDDIFKLQKEVGFG